MLSITSLILVILGLQLIDGSPITIPLVSDEHIDHVIPHYLENHPSNAGREPLHKAKPVVAEDIKHIEIKSDSKYCISDFKTRWVTELESPAFSTPVLFPAAQSIEKLIFSSGYVKAVEMVNHEGYKPLGWPISFEQSTFQGSPILYDVDGDGNNDIGVVDKNGNMFWIRVDDIGQYLDDFHFQVPKLKIKRDWYVNLDPNVMDNFVLLSMFDHRNHNMGVNHFENGAFDRSDHNSQFWRDPSTSEKTSKSAKLDSLSVSPNIVKASKKVAEPRRLTSIDEDSENIPTDSPSIQDSNDMDHHDMDHHNMEVPDFGDGPGYGEEEGLDGYHNDDYVPNHYSMEGLEHSDNNSNSHDQVGDSLPSMQDHFPQNLDGFMGSMDDVYGSHYFTGPSLQDEEVVFVDPHVLSSPVLVDIDGDGHMEVIMAVSYYFDAEEYRDKKLDFDPEMYIAGGIVCWDLQSQDWTWLVHLDLTTNLGHFKAMIYSSPTVADLDGDGRLEILIGTSMGLLYLLDGETGFVRRYFPLQFHEIQSQISVANVRGGSELEVLVGDMAGNVAVVSGEGEILWHRRLSGSLPYPITVGDVDGDGIVDLVVIAVTDKPFQHGYENHVWVLRGDTGEVIPGYPKALPRGSQASAPVMLVDLHLHPSLSQRSGGSLSGRDSVDSNLPPWLNGSPGHPSPSTSTSGMKGSHNPMGDGLHLLISCHDGHLLIVEGKGRCTERLDLGQPLSNVPLIDDLTQDGFLDIVIATLDGQLMLIETLVPSHPMNSWNAFPNHRQNGFSLGQLGLSIPSHEKRKLLISAPLTIESNVSFAFDIWDMSYHDSKKQSLPHQSDSTSNHTTSTIHESLDHQEDSTESEFRYIVTITRGTNRLEPLFRKEYTKPGRYVAHFATNPPEKSLLVVSMTTKHGLYVEDTVLIHSGSKFVVWIKYLILVPLMTLALPLLLMRFRKSSIILQQRPFQQQQPQH